LFKGRHFDSSIIILCLRWYITYKLNYHDLRNMMAERGIDLAHTTILRLAQRYVPEFDKQWRRYLRPVHTPGRGKLKLLLLPFSKQTAPKACRAIACLF
jgi:transposase-like protein